MEACVELGEMKIWLQFYVSPLPLARILLTIKRAERVPGRVDLDHDTSVSSSGTADDQPRFDRNAVRSSDAFGLRRASLDSTQNNNNNSARNVPKNEERDGELQSVASQEEDNVPPGKY